MFRRTEMTHRLTLTSKELTLYINFLKRLKSIGNDFLIKGDIWTPSIKTVSNSPGTHISRDPILTKIYSSEEDIQYTRYTCSNLDCTIESLKTDMPKGKKQGIAVEMTEQEISLYVNDTQWVIASKYLDSTEDFCPQYSMFGDIIKEHNWSSFLKDTLQCINDYHPVSIIGKVDGTDEKTTIRLAKNLFKLSGVKKKSIDYCGEYSVTDTKEFDETVAKLTLHMIYPNIECAHIYYIRKY